MPSERPLAYILDGHEPVPAAVDQYISKYGDFDSGPMM